MVVSGIFLIFAPNYINHVSSMRLLRLAITLMILVSALAVHADEASEIRTSLPQLKGEKLLDALDRLYRLSQETDDLFYQLTCLNNLIAEADRQQNWKKACEGRVMKMVFFYNTEQDDSLYEQIPPTLDFLRGKISLGNYYVDCYYVIWTLLVNVYNFSGNTNEGLAEVKRMFEDAKLRQDKHGMGLAYFAMANVYSNMYNPDEAAKSYSMSIDLLMQVTPLPMQLTEVFSFFADELVSQKKYDELEQMTVRWKTFLNNQNKERPFLSEGETDNNWGYYYMACAQAALGKGDLEKAEAMLNEAKGREAGYDKFINRMWLHLQASLLMRQKRYQEALKLNDQSMEQMMCSDDKSVMIRTRQQRAEILEALGRYQEAAQLYREMYTINDSINSNDIKRQLTEMNARFDNEHLKLEQQEERNRNILIIVSIIITGLVIFIIFRYHAAQRLKAAHNKLEDAHQQLLTAYDQLEETTTAKERIESELRIARDIQMGMVPQVFPPFPERTDIDLFGSITPAKAVGGDLYDFFILDEKLYFCLGDVSGKGVPASLFMAVAVNLFRVASKQQLPPAEIATRLNSVLADRNENAMFVTMFIGVADLHTGRLEFCNAGHNPPVIKDAGGHARFLEMIPNSPLGFWPGLEYEGESVEDISMMPFLLYSDGLTEAEDADSRQFGDEHLLELMEQIDYEGAEQTIGMLNVEVDKHVKGAEQSDDLTMLCLRIQGNKQINHTKL